MKDLDGNEIDLSDKHFGITLEPPVTVGIDPDTGALMISAPQLQFFGATYSLFLPPQAAAELAATLKRIESWLGRPIEDLAKPNSVQ